MGLVAAVAKANAAEEKQRELAREREIARVTSRILAGKSAEDPGQEELAEMFVGLLTVELDRQMAETMGVVLSVAEKSANLKGMFV